MCSPLNLVVQIIVLRCSLLVCLTIQLAIDNSE